MEAVRELALLVAEKGFDAAVFTDAETARHVIQNCADVDAAFRDICILNLNDEKHLSRYDFLLVTKDGFCYVVSPRAWKNAGQYENKTLGLYLAWDSGGVSDILRDIAAKHKIKTCGYEPIAMNVHTYQNIIKDAPFSLAETGRDAYERVRRIHTPNEMEKIKKALRIAEEALEELLPKIVPGAVELDLKHELIANMIKRGASAPSCLLLTSGKATGLAHVRPTAKRVEEGDLVMIDFGCVYEDYCSDITRTFAVGRATDEQIFHYNLVLEAQRAAMDAFREGLAGRDLHNAALNVFAREGLGEYFTHGVGHNIGVDLHERPWCGPDSEDVIEAGHAMTIEPGIYFENKYGIRVEDTLYLSGHGTIQLSKPPRENMIL